MLMSSAISSIRWTVLGRVLKLVEVSTERGSSESEVDMVTKQIAKMAERYNTTPEKVMVQAKKKVEKLELKKSIEDHEAQRETDLLNEIERLDHVDGLDRLDLEGSEDLADDQPVVQRKTASVSVGEAVDDLYVTVPHRSRTSNRHDGRLYTKNTQRVSRYLTG
jgi:hypothetical protein